MQTFTLRFRADFDLLPVREFSNLALAAAALVEARVLWPLSDAHVLDADGFVVQSYDLRAALLEGLKANETFAAIISEPTPGTVPVGDPIPAPVAPVLQGTATVVPVSRGEGFNAPRGYKVTTPGEPGTGVGGFSFWPLLRDRDDAEIVAVGLDTGATLARREFFAL